MGVMWPKGNENKLSPEVEADREAYVNQVIGRLQGAMSVCNYIIWAHMAGPDIKDPRINKIAKAVERAQADLDQALKEALGK